jgi:hypothetical protein
MSWSGTGFGAGWEVHFRELPGVELSTGEQQAALQREIMRRRMRDTTP